MNEMWLGSQFYVYTHTSAFLDTYLQYLLIYSSLFDYPL